MGYGVRFCRILQARNSAQEATSCIYPEIGFHSAIYDSDAQLHSAVSHLELPFLTVVIFCGKVLTHASNISQLPHKHLSMNASMSDGLPLTENNICIPLFSSIRAKEMRFAWQILSSVGPIPHYYCIRCCGR